MPTVPFDSVAPRVSATVAEQPRPSEPAPRRSGEQPTLDMSAATFDRGEAPTVGTPIPALPAALHRDTVAPAAGPTPPAAADTSALPGVAGSKAEHQLPTGVIKKARTTSPVDEESIEAELSASGPPSADLFATRTDVPIPTEFQPQGHTGSDLIGVTETAQPTPAEIATTREVKLGEWAVTGAQAATPQPADQIAVPPTGALAAVPKTRVAGVVVSIAAAIVVLVVSAYLVWTFAFSKSKSQTGTIQPGPPVAEAPSAPAPGPDTEATPTPPEGMVYVAAGTYIVGRDDRDPLESPKHSVQLSAFFIDKTEVTNAAYKKFVDATGRSAPSGWEGGVPPPGADDLPVTGVTWQDAADYADWVGKRLPTEAEWEAAARGLEGLNYPWGNQWRSDVANIGALARGIDAVGTHKEGASPSGALDMIGNVWEWTADEFSLYPGSKAPTPKVIVPGASFRVIRGGAYDGKEIHDASYRGFVDAAQGYPKTGFRCVKSAPR